MIKRLYFIFFLTLLVACGNPGGGKPKPPAVPTGLRAIPMDGAVRLTWIANTEANLARYVIRISENQDGSGVQTQFTAYTNEVGKDQTAAIVSGLANGKKHWFAIKAENSSNLSSAYSAPVSATPNNDPPATPKGFKAIPGNKKVTLSWAANSEKDLEKYIIWFGSSPNPTNSKNADKSVTSLVIDGLNNGSKYYFAIQAEKSSGRQSPKSAVISATPSQNDTTAPQVLSTIPKDKAKDVATSAKIIIKFSEEMDKDKTNATVSPKADCSWSWNSNFDELTCSHTKELNKSTKYMVRVGGQDLAGNDLGIYSFSFDTAAKAGPGSVDKSFGEQGFYIGDIGRIGSADLRDALYIANKIYLIGFAEFKYNNDYKDWIVLVRLTQDGKLDTGFANHGIAKVMLSGKNDRAFAAAIHQNKIYVAAASEDDKNMAIVSFNLDGTLNTTFNSSGYLIKDLGGYNDNGVDIAVDKSSGIIYLNTYSDRVLAFNTNGTLVTSFGQNGVVDVGSEFNNSRSAAIAAKNGKILIAGASANGRGNDFVIIRLDKQGKLDRSFSADGRVVIDLSKNTTGYAYDYACTIINDGTHILVGGRADGKFAIVRLDNKGNLDTQFGNKGSVIDDAAGKVIYAMAIDKNKNIVVTGESKQSRMAIARYNADGSPDNSFGFSGHVVIDKLREGKAVLFDQNQNIIVASGNDDFQTLRLKP